MTYDTFTSADVAVMHEDEAREFADAQAYDYRAQRWVPADHVHLDCTAGGNGPAVYCGCTLFSCPGEPTATDFLTGRARR